ncbi:type VI immunity family protein [Melittangium boletus]|uniref:DUF3396 domain-containing protein n=1 Tax=Melittangium boletus DSM 14713 TaxID=1294270 RepID=A0A286NV54_9BACT|nr:type VI immunity family protein [Melittangium boletus]ATB26957.1 hypothetical protein MEBOL_000392 [Melittangium boletus DSM 14713]
MEGPLLPQRQVIAREVFRVAFYMPHDHPTLASGVSHALDIYMHAVGQGPKTINSVHYNHHEGSQLTTETWRLARGLLENTEHWSFPEDYDNSEQAQIEKRGFERGLLLTGGSSDRNGYEFEYRARIPWRPAPDEMIVSLLTATLPFEYLEEHGPARVRQLALDMASKLLFASGHAGLAIHVYRNLRLTDNDYRAEVLRYPGIDLRAAWHHEKWMGLQVDGVHWLNFLGPPLLTQLGGANTLRSRLHSAETTLREITEERIMVSLGEKPETGDLLKGDTLPAYREFARVMEPWFEPIFLKQTLASEDEPRYTALRFTENEARRWWSRFLD